MPPLPALFIANDKSRSGATAAHMAEILEQRGMALRRESPDGTDALDATIRRLQAEIGCVILCGGDGTLHAAAQAIHDTGLTFGIVPLGTANDLARSLGIDSDPETALEVILAGKTRTIDLGTVNGKPFFNVASLGLSVAVTRRLNGILKRRLGPLAYPVAAAMAITSQGRFRASMRADGEEIVTKTLQIAIGNGRYYGGGAVVHRDAQVDDGTLSVYSLEPRARWRLILLARAFKEGRHDELREVRQLTCRTLTVMTHRPRDITADGEIVGSTPAHFAVLPRAVTVFAP